MSSLKLRESKDLYLEESTFKVNPQETITRYYISDLDGREFYNENSEKDKHEAYELFKKIAKLTKEEIINLYQETGCSGYLKGWNGDYNFLKKTA